MAEWYLSNNYPLLICVKNSYSCNGNKLVEIGQQCYTRQLDFGCSYLNWVGIWVNDIYCGAHRSRNFMYLSLWRQKRIDEILE